MTAGALLELVAAGASAGIAIRPRPSCEERERLWQRWAEIDRNLDGYAARRPRETAVVVEPRAATD